MTSATIRHRTFVERFCGWPHGRKRFATNPPSDARVRVIHPPHASAMSRAMARPKPLLPMMPRAMSVLALILFRLVWGVMGPRHARFASFVPSPTRLRAYLSGLAAAGPSGISATIRPER